jgi:tetraacyldisaccharide 4'-kinase
MPVLLWPLAVAYGGVIAARNLYYDRVSSAVRSAGVPAISVGNLTVGGTGKTPFVIEVVRRLRAWGHHPVILTRGYRGQPGAVADEVLEFRDAVPDVPVVVNPDRVAGAAQARAQHNAGCLVLDDGFQHRRLARDLDIVLIDALNPWGGGCLLPAGRLREPAGSLRRADVLVITRANQAPPAALEGLKRELGQRWPGRLLVIAEVVAERLFGRDGQVSPPADLRARRVLAVCGLGNPHTFGGLVRSLTPTCELLKFADHQSYGEPHIGRILTRARESRADSVVTTRKDWVKLAPLWPAGGLELVRLDVRLVLSGPVVEFEDRLRKVAEMRS